MVRIPVSPEQASAQTLSEEVSERLDAAHQAAGAAGLTLQPPILALGISERVGSNWFLDTLAKGVHTHNEPFRQQLHASHPMSTIVSRCNGLDDYVSAETHPYENYWLTNFVVSKYSSNPQLVKETNLFFATDNLLRLFPDSKALVLARDPVGIASSFADNDLFRRWNYAERYNQLKSMTRQPQYNSYAFVFEGEHDPGSLRKLTRLIVLNTLLLSRALGSRDNLIVRYEDSVMDRENTMNRVAEFLKLKGMEFVTTSLGERDPTGNGHVFSTRKRKLSLEAHLGKDDLETVNTEVRRLLADSLSVLDVSQYEEAQVLLEPSSHRYVALGRMSLNNVAEDGPQTSAEKPDFEYVHDPETNLMWANQPVCNADFVVFMNNMYQEGIPNVINGAQLFVNENMIPSRGGRVWFNANQGIYEVTPGYEDHPVYWVTWLGAAAYARYQGARLPSREELLALMGPPEAIDFTGVNSDHKQADASKIGQEPSNELGVYDLVGNVASWCRDGYMEAPGMSMNRYIVGTAWNREGSPSELIKFKTRPLTGCSRSTGVRLVADKINSLTPPQIAERFEGWFGILARQNEVERTDRYIIDQLTR